MRPDLDSRFLIPALALAALAGALPPGAAGARRPAAVEQPRNALLQVRFPAAVPKVCRELARRTGSRIRTGASLTDFRVVWSFQHDVPLETTLARLAELTDSELQVENAGAGKPRYTLKRRASTLRLEAAWPAESLRRSLVALLAAAQAQAASAALPASVTPNLRHSFDSPYAVVLPLLPRLSPDWLPRLLRAGSIPLPPDSLRESELAQIFRQDALMGDPDRAPRDVQEDVDGWLDAVRKRGASLELSETTTSPEPFRLELRLPTHVLDLEDFGDNELGIRSTRTNPYRFLEAGAPDLPAEPPGEMPAALRTVLNEDVVLNSPGDWPEAVRQFSRVAKIDLMADAFLCRFRRGTWIWPGQHAVLIPKGRTVAEGLDSLCQQYGALWWERDGCCYLRARTWPWDMEYEVSERFLDSWLPAARRPSGIGVPQLAELASLTFRQREGLLNFGTWAEQAEGVVTCVVISEEVTDLLNVFRTLAPFERFWLVGRGLLLPPERLSAGPSLLTFSGMTDGSAPPAPVLLRLWSEIGELSEGDRTLRRTPVLVHFTVATPSAARQTQFLLGLPARPDPFTPEPAEADNPRDQRLSR